jgi:cell division protein FtsZ
METPPLAQQPEDTGSKPFSIKVIAVGTAGIKVLERVLARKLPGLDSVAIDTDATALTASSAARKLQLEQEGSAKITTGGDPVRGRRSAENRLEELKKCCEGAHVVFILAGMGGGTGTGVSSVVAKAAREAGALAMGFVFLPFDCEGNCRQRVALSGRDELMAAADCVISFPNQRKLKLIDKNTSVSETFLRCNELLADGVAGVWRLLNCSGLTRVHFGELSALLKDHHAESSVATAEAAGPERSRELIEKLMSHPMLASGRTLAEADGVVVGLTGGPDLAMVELNYVMEQINRRCNEALVLMGAISDENFQDRLAITILTVEKTPAALGEKPRAVVASESEDLGNQLLRETPTPRPGSRFVPPPPNLEPEKARQLLARQSASTRGRKSSSRPRQTQLPLELISKGRFDKSEPTIHNGEDLDLPAYVRRGVTLN